jgi:biotin carboxyl carrier protein
MKMETVIVSKIDGTIKSIKVLTNDMVKDNQLLIELS